MEKLARYIAVNEEELLPADGRLVPRQQAQWLAHNLPHANLRILGKTGHAPQIEMANDCPNSCAKLALRVMV